MIFLVYAVSLLLFICIPNPDLNFFREGTRRFMIKFFLLLALVSAHFEILFSGTTCEGMWSKFDIPFANSNSKINIKFNNPQTPSSKIDCVIYNYLDESNILNAPRCALTSISSGAAGYCKPNTAKEITTKKFNILNEILTPNQTVEFQVDQTGWFCIEVSSPLLEDFSVSVEYINPYGRIPAQDYFKLPLYGCLSLVYLFIAIVWLFRSYRIGFNELLPIQIYLTGVIFFLMAEQAINYAYYENYNKNGSSSKVFVIIVSTFNAARNSISFYILLIVCLGYGVCRPTLGNTMKKCIILAIVHFVCGALYSAGTLLLDDKAGVLMVLIFVMPLSLSMTIFYSWTLQGLHKTMDKLKQKRQTVKLLMYQRLQMILVCSLISLIGAFTLNAININYKDSPTWKPYFWKYVWIILGIIK